MNIVENFKNSSGWSGTQIASLVLGILFGLFAFILIYNEQKTWHSSALKYD